MIKSSEYKILLSKMKEISPFIRFTEEEVEMFDNLRQLFNKFVKQASYHYWYPHLDIEKEVKPYAIDIKEFCKSFGLQYKFYELTKETHMTGVYVVFYYQGNEITPIIDLMPGKKEFKYK